MRLQICLLLAMSTLAIAVSAGNVQARHSTKIAGFEVNCRDNRGQVVRTMKVSDLGDVGRAWVVNGVPFIIMDVDLMRKLPPKLRLFFYGHECAHHVLGHWYNPSRNSEVEADCWAIRDARDRNLFSRAEVASFAPYFAKSKGSRWGHLPGPKRASLLLQCYDTQAEKSSDDVD